MQRTSLARHPSSTRPAASRSRLESTTLATRKPKCSLSHSRSSHGGTEGSPLNPAIVAQPRLCDRPDPVALSPTSAPAPGAGVRGHLGDREPRESRQAVVRATLPPGLMIYGDRAEPDGDR